jgi:hypothetical protein
VSRHRDTRGFDLPVREVAVRRGLQAVFAEADGRAALRMRADARTVLFAVLGALRHQHG